MVDRLGDAVAAIAREAGALAYSRWRTDFRRWEKAPGNPVCEVDIEVDTLLRERLTTLLPDAGWLSEESLDNKDRLTRKRVWVVDPIDGTRDYVGGRNGWAVSIALVDDGRVVLGVLDAPVSETAYRAELGRGATRNGLPIRVIDRTEIAGSRVPADRVSKLDRDLVTVGKPNSIALRIAMLAAGEADLVASARWGYEWDIAAAALIAGEAGAAVSDAFGAPLAFNTPTAQMFGVLATAPGIHVAAIARLANRASFAEQT